MNLYVLFVSILISFLTPFDHKDLSSKVVLFEAVLVDVAMTECSNARGKKISSKFLSDLLFIEKASGIPDAYRGMVLAAACSESGYSSKARGDGGKAVGILQLWPWWKRVYSVDRTDPYESADIWTGQIMKTLPKARRKCGKRRAFVSAWAWVASGPKGWKCRAPRHYTRLKRWHRIVRNRMRHLW